MSNILSLNNLQKALDKKGWTLKELADKYDEKYPDKDGKTVYHTLRKWNGRNANPTLKIFVRVCNLLDCDMEYLVGTQKEPRKGIERAAKLTGLSHGAAEYLVKLNKRGALDPASLMLKTLSEIIIQAERQEKKGSDRALLPYLNYYLNTDYFPAQRDKKAAASNTISPEYDRDWGTLQRELARFVENYRQKRWHTD